MKNKDREQELAARERALAAKEKELAEREKRLENKPFSRALQAQKEQWYDKVPLSVKQLDVVIWIVGIALGLVFLLIVLEAAGIFKL